MEELRKKKCKHKTELCYNGYGMQRTTVMILVGAYCEKSPIYRNRYDTV